MTVGSLTAFAQDVGLEATKRLARHEQKSLGQFMTPAAIARVMARRACVAVNQGTVRVLDPAAGSGVLTAAVLDCLLSAAERPRHIELTLWDIDPRLAPTLKRLADRSRRAGRAVGVEVTVSTRIGDFLLQHDDTKRYDLIISNPPYFKLNKADIRARRHSYAVYGQPNIYGLFMAATARLLASCGRWCFITPRSWTNGPYFSAVRREILRSLQIEAMHVFESRAAHFTDDEVLQEAMITWATARDKSEGPITVSVSTGVRDLDRAVLRTVPSAEIIGPAGDRVIYLPTTEPCVPALDCGLAALGLKVSTGPVVAFRAAEYLAETRSRSTVPLLWMQHIQHMRVQWPIQKKREHLHANGETAWMLLPNTTMVVLRRFSPKEDPRRVTAAPLLRGQLPGDHVGLENHTNYIYRPGGTMAEDEARGLAAFLNSRIVDAYLRKVSGNTQVNAADLRSMPMPSSGHLNAIGRAVKSYSSLADVDRAVELVFGARHRVAIRG